MTAEALSAADGPSRVAPHGDAEEFVEARQSVLDVVAARFVQVAEPDAGPDAPPNGAHANGAHGDPPSANGAHPQDAVQPEGEPLTGGQQEGEPLGGEPPRGEQLTGEPPRGEQPEGEQLTGELLGGEPPRGEQPADEPPEGERADAAGDLAEPVELGEPAELREAELRKAELREAELREPALGDLGEPAPLPDPTAERAAVVGEVEEILEPAGDAGRSTAASAVLDVLRATGWADAEEARELRAEADRLRELLDLVVRDHRAREASAAGLETQQHYWLIPLLRAAHGVAFGSLGAKVALRTAVQDVPDHILSTAGLRIDYGVEPTGEPYDER